MFDVDPGVEVKERADVTRLEVSGLSSELNRADQQGVCLW